MRLWINRLALVAALAVALPFAARAQSAPATSNTHTAASALQARSSLILHPEAQPSLTVDRDPIVSPDAEDNVPVSPGHPGPASRGVVLQRGANGRFTFTQNVNEVILNASVFDKHGQMVNSLTKPDFKVWEDGVPQVITYFSHEDIPVSIGLVIDNSGSMREKRAAVNEAALDLVRASNPDDETFVVNFSDEAYLDQDFTSSIAALKDGLSHIDSRGGTALYDAVAASADHLEKAGKRPKKVLLVITDGEDNASSLDLEQTIRRVQDLRGPVVYSIGLLFGDDGDPGESRRAKRALELLSEETGGIAFFPRSLADVDPIAAEVAEDIRHQYTIGYHSTKPESVPGYRTVKVEARAPGYGKLTVRTRSGYYPQALPGAAKANH